MNSIPNNTKNVGELEHLNDVGRSNGFIPVIKGPDAVTIGVIPSIFLIQMSVQLKW